MDIIERLKFDAARCEATFSKGVASNIEEAAAEIERLRAALEAIAKLCRDDEQTQIAREALGWAGRNVVPDESR